MAPKTPEVKETKNEEPAKKKFDMSSIVDSVQKEFKGKDISNKVGLGSTLRILEDKDYLKLGKWWSEPTNLPGIPFGKVTLIAGGPDSGKSSMAIQCMKAAQEQGVAILYTESEQKTTAKDFICWGVDPDNMLVNRSSLAEEAFTLTISSWEQFSKKYPNDKILIIIDSLGNVISKRDATIDLMEDSQKPGGKGAINRIGLNKMIAKLEESPNVAILLITYTYDNIGSVGKTNSGGQALNFFSSLTYQTSRKAWYEKTENGRKIRAGADVVFKLYKNHLQKDNPGAKEIVFRITREGMECLDKKEE